SLVSITPVHASAPLFASNRRVSETVHDGPVTCCGGTRTVSQYVEKPPQPTPTATVAPGTVPDDRSTRVTRVISTPPAPDPAMTWRNSAASTWPRFPSTV